MDRPVEALAQVLVNVLIGKVKTARFSMSGWSTYRVLCCNTSKRNGNTSSLHCHKV